MDDAAPQSPADLQASYWQAHAKGDAAGMKSVFQQMQAQGVHLTAPPAGSIPLRGASDNPDQQMEFSDNFGAGVGRALHSTAQGIGQLVGLSSQKDVDESKRIDASLLSTPSGKAGDLGGTIAQFNRRRCWRARCCWQGSSLCQRSDQRRIVRIHATSRRWR
jgi:hypothetical protein